VLLLDMLVPVVRYKNDVEWFCVPDVLYVCDVFGNVEWTILIVTVEVGQALNAHKAQGMQGDGNVFIVKQGACVRCVSGGDEQTWF